VAAGELKEPRMPKTPPAFFIPTCPPDEQEERYANFALRCGRPVPKPAQRVYSITFVHDGVKWTATVGETLHGIEQQTSRSIRRREERFRRSDPTTVLAIFPGDPYWVVTDARNTAFANPFMASRQPERVTCFSEDGGAG
jgi:hypothetical protein